MIRFLAHSEIDKAKWDACILKASNSFVYGYSWYLDIVSPQWQALVLDDYEAVMPLTWLKKWFVSYLSQPLFTQQLGVFSPDVKPLLVEEFLKILPHHFRYIDLYLNEKNNSRFPAESTVNTRKTQYLDLTKEYTDLFKKYHPKLRKNIRKASDAGLSMDTNISPSIVTDMFMNIQGEKLALKNKETKTRLEILLETLLQKGFADIRGVRTANGELCATIFFISSSDRVIYFKGASTELGKENSATHFLLDNCIKNSCGKHTIFDFGGSMIPGVENFFKTFGAEDLFYYHYIVNNLPWPLNWFKN